MSAHGRDSTIPEELYDRLLRRYTAQTCAAGRDTCPMHYKMAERVVARVLDALVREGWAIRKVASADPPESTEEFLRQAGHGDIR